MVSSWALLAKKEKGLGTALQSHNNRSKDTNKKKQEPGLIKHGVYYMDNRV